MKNYWNEWIDGKTQEDRSLKKERVAWANKYIGKRMEGTESPQPNFKGDAKGEELLSRRIINLSASESGRKILEGMRHAWYTKKGRLLKQGDNYRSFTWWLPNSISGKLSKLARAMDSYTTHADVVAELIVNADAFKRTLEKELEAKSQKRKGGGKKSPLRANFKHRAELASLRKEIRQLHIRLNNEIFARLRAETTLLRENVLLQELTDEEEQEIAKMAKQERRDLADLIKNISH